MNPLQKGIDRLSDMCVDEFYQFSLSISADHISIGINHECTPCYEWLLRYCDGKYSFGEEKVSTDDVENFCDGLESWITSKEKDSPVSCDIGSAMGVIDRLLRRAPVLLFAAQAYTRLERLLDIPKVTDLPDLSDERLEEVRKRIDEYSFQITCGASIRISNIACLCPLTIHEGEHLSYVFDPRLLTYQTGEEGAVEFRECLRRVKKKI